MQTSNRFSVLSDSVSSDKQMRQKASPDTAQMKENTQTSTEEKQYYVSRKQIRYLVTERQASLMMSSVCRLFRNHKEQRICISHSMDELDKYVSGNVQNLLVQYCDVPGELQELVVEHKKHFMYNFGNIPGYILLHVEQMDEWHDTEEFYTFSVSSQNMTENLQRIEEYYRNILNRRYACSSCCMTLLSLAYNSRTRSIIRPHGIIGFPKDIRFGKLNDVDFMRLVQRFIDIIPDRYTLSEFMKKINVVRDDTLDLDALYDFQYHVSFPEITLIQQAKQAQWKSTISDYKQKLRERDALTKLKIQQEQIENAKRLSTATQNLLLQMIGWTKPIASHDDDDDEYEVNGDH